MRTTISNHLLRPQALTLALLALPAATACGDGESSSGPVEPLERQLSAIVERSLSADLPGATLRVLGDGHDITVSAGLADLESSAPLTPEHRFQVASSGKAFVGVALTRLIADGTIDPGASLDTWLPEPLVSRISNGERITLEHLLEHTSGIVDVLNDMPETFERIVADPERVWTNTDLVALAQDVPLSFEPGTSHRYSNTNYMLAAMILSSVTGKRHGAALRDLVFEPAAMHQTTTSNAGEPAGPLASGYHFVGDAYDSTLVVASRWEAGSGGQWSTVHDQARFMKTVFETDRLVNDDGRALLLAGSEHAAYGFGFMWTQTPLGPMIYHHGRSFGYSSYMAYFPEARLAVAVNVNAISWRTPEATSADALFGAVMQAIEAHSSGEFID